MDVDFSIYLATKTRWAHLEKRVSLPGIPRVGEFVKFRNAEMGDYFAFEVASVTYREVGAVEVMTELLDNVDGRMYSFDEEHELDGYVASFLREGWRCERGIGANRRLLGREPLQDGA
ncbi:MAG TPA: hypothetical protein VGP07_05960 [Polyangia bacterium]|jgi:hypothetical protein